VKGSRFLRTVNNNELVSVKEVSMNTIMRAVVISFILTGNAIAGEALWGSATILETEYKPQKVVYDVSVASVKAVTSVLDRASYLSRITGADPFDSSIVLVLHGHEINYFARKNYARYKDLMRRVQSLVEGEVLKVRMCEIAAQAHGYEAEDIHGFIEMVPMGDAEIIRLQNEEAHAYMQ
jgi:intracellular sulfur oxidation DsrE/DsrF family protein